MINFDICVNCKVKLFEEIYEGKPKTQRLALFNIKEYIKSRRIMCHKKEFSKIVHGTDKVPEECGYYLEQVISERKME